MNLSERSQGKRLSEDSGSGGRRDSVVIVFMDSICLLFSFFWGGAYVHMVINWPVCSPVMPPIINICCTIKLETTQSREIAGQL